ncbi:MAG TPA: hypothetical protein VGK00_08960 [Anaerolineales bacterium]|jgi:uncharacterized membrane protein YgcG
MQKNRVYILASLVVTAALLFSVTGAFARSTEMLGNLGSVFAPKAQAVQSTDTPAPGDSQSSKQEITGVVQAITDTSITVDGVVYNLQGDEKLGSDVKLGDTVKLEVFSASDGSLTVDSVDVVDAIQPGDNNGGTGSETEMEQEKDDDQDDDNSANTVETGDDNSSGQSGQSGESEQNSGSSHESNDKSGSHSSGSDDSSGSGSSGGSDD